MRIDVFPIDFMGAPPLYEPKDRALFDAAIDYCSRELSQTPDFVRLNKIWVAIANAEFREGKFVSGDVVGITGYVLKPDIPVFRVSGPNAARATKMLTDRYHAYFADQGWRGCEVFIHISAKERPEQRCNRWVESLAATGATPAERFAVTVR